MARVHLLSKALSLGVGGSRTSEWKLSLIAVTVTSHHDSPLNLGVCVSAPLEARMRDDTLSHSGGKQDFTGTRLFFFEGQMQI